MQAQVGDELTVKGRHQGDEDRHGEIIEVIGADGAPPYMVRWRDGFESLFYIRLRPGSATAQDPAQDTRGRAHLIHHPSGDGTGDAPSALALVCATPDRQPDPAPGADINDRRTELTGQADAQPSTSVLVGLDTWVGRWSGSGSAWSAGRLVNAKCPFKRMLSTGCDGLTCHPSLAA